MSDGTEVVRKYYIHVHHCSVSFLQQTLLFVFSLSYKYIHLTDSHENRRGRHTRQADTNVLAVKFNKLTDPSNIHTGDAVVCSNAHCTAILSHLSKLSDHEDPQKDEKVYVRARTYRLSMHIPSWAIP